MDIGMMEVGYMCAEYAIEAVAAAARPEAERTAATPM